MQHVIFIPEWLPPTLNALTRGKLRARVRLGKECKNIIGVYAFSAGVPKATGRRSVRLRFEHGPGKRRPDTDSYFKAVLDSLKTAGVIRDDGPTWLKLESPELVKSHRTCTTITLEDIGEE